MEFDRFDICEAYWVFFCDWHGGIGFDLYGKPLGVDTKAKRPRPCHHFDIQCQLNRLKFVPRSDLQYDTLCENAKAIYADLLHRFGYEMPESYRRGESELFTAESFS